MVVAVRQITLESVSDVEKLDGTVCIAGLPALKIVE
ncbi:unnamed protein product [Ectocarpus sp. CCAP 1310/34]|nr:unnamed protein product [Ectocarpus sp. CCAP 1310/34]